MNKRAINNTNGSRTCLVFPWVFHMSAILQHQWHFCIWVFPKSTNEIDLPKLQSDPSMVDDRHQKRRTPSKAPSPTELKNRTQGIPNSVHRAPLFSRSITAYALLYLTLQSLRIAQSRFVIGRVEVNEKLGK